MTQTIAWTLIHFCWQGALLAVTLAVALRALRHRSAEARYIASCATLALMVAVAAGTFAYLRQAPLAVASRSVTAARPIVATVGNAAPLPNNPWLPWITTFWAAGVIGLSLRWFAAWMLLRRRTRNAPLIELPELQALQTRLGVLRRIAVRSADWLTSPAVAGWVRPVLLVPASALSGLDRTQLEAVLAHELAHIRRHDYFWNLVQTAAETLLFYHPAIWWVSGRIRAERENCCDDVALELCGDRAMYARALLRINELAVPELSLAASRGPLHSRIGRILHGESGTPALWPLAVAAIVVGAMLFTGAPRIKAQQNLPTAYKKWVREDAAYIIKPEERARFRDLKTDAERDSFIEQFWTVRGGRPAKEEHYRRVMYADQHWGWKSDRGHRYIISGSPDQVETDGNTEEWRYDSKSFTIRFVDGKEQRPKEHHEIGAHIHNVLLRWHNQIYNAVFGSSHDN